MRDNMREAIDGWREDSLRLDLVQELLAGADFQWGYPPQPVLVIRLPEGAKVSASIRLTLDDIRRMRGIL